MIHKLKTWTPYFNAVVDGRKKFEKRTWDRDYKVGDLLCLYEWNPHSKYTGKKIAVIVTYILDFINDSGEFSDPGVCLMSIDKLDKRTLDMAGKMCRDLYELHYEISMMDYIKGYDKDDQKDVKYNHWVRACGAVDCAIKLEELGCR